jgi:hypothetical protein
MEWLTWIIIEGAVAAFLVLIRLSLVRSETARDWLDKGTSVVDLHSLSGIRSGMGKAMLRKMGYPNVFNLGSYGRADRILGAQVVVGRRG